MLTKDEMKQALLTGKHVEINCLGEPQDMIGITRNLIHVNNRWLLIGILGRENPLEICLCSDFDSETILIDHMYLFNQRATHQIIELLSKLSEDITDAYNLFYQCSLASSLVTREKAIGTIWSVRELADEGSA